MIIIPLALIASESIAYSAFGLMGYWLRAHSGSKNNCSTVYSQTSTNGHLLLQWPLFLSQRTVHALYWLLFKPLYNRSISLQWHNSQKHVSNYQNNLSKMASFLSHFWKSQEWPWNLICKARWWLILSQQSFILIVFHLYCYSKQDFSTSFVRFVKLTFCSKILFKFLGHYLWLD